MEALEKIYLQVEDDDGDRIARHEFMTWCQDRIYQSDLEYILAGDYDLLKTRLDEARKKIERQRESLAKLEQSRTDMRKEIARLRKGAPAVSLWDCPACHKTNLEEDGTCAFCSAAPTEMRLDTYVRVAKTL